MENPVVLIRYQKDPNGEAMFLSELLNCFVADQNWIDIEVFADDKYYFIAKRSRDVPKYTCNCQCQCSGGPVGPVGPVGPAA